jgi:hypothetical protein
MSLRSRSEYPQNFFETLFSKKIPAGPLSIYTHIPPDSWRDTAGQAAGRQFPAVFYHKIHLDRNRIKKDFAYAKPM